MARLSVLSPRGGDREIEDLATIHGLTARQRVSRRRRRRRPAPRARRSGRIALALLGGAALAALGVAGARWCLTSPRFAVAQVQVRGLSRLTPEEIEQAAGIRQGENLFRIDPAAAVMRIEALPQVRSAEVVRSLPNQVTVMVEERRPFTLVHSGHLHWVDEEGVALAPESRAVSVGLPVISGLSPDELTAAHRAPSPRVAAALSLIRMLLRASSPLTNQISEIDVSRPEGPVLYTVDGVEVRLGKEEWEARIPRLIGVLAQVASSGEAVSAIDLRFRDQVILQTAGGK